MKVFDRVKTVELFAFVAFAAVCFYRIVVASNIYQEMATDSNLRIVCLLLWAAMFMCFFMIFIDFSMFSRQNQNLTALSQAANTDTVARIGNRFSVDSIIDEYAEKDIPREMGCAMIELVSLKDVNAKQGRMGGNDHIRNFSLILTMSALDECVVGRNGGNRFIVLYEKEADLHLEVFLDRLAEKVRDHNASGKHAKIVYNCGTAYAGIDDITSITRLIALSSMRLNENAAQAEMEEAMRLAGGASAEDNYTAWDADVPLDYEYENGPIGVAADEKIAEMIPKFEPIILTPEDLALIAYEKSRQRDIKRSRSMIAKRSMRI